MKERSEGLRSAREERRKQVHCIDTQEMRSVLVGVTLVWLYTFPSMLSN